MKYPGYGGWNMIVEKRAPSAGGAFSGIRVYTWGSDLSGSMQGAGGVGGLLSVQRLTDFTNPTWTMANYYPTYDGNGNVSEYLDDAGVVIAHYEYDPFGNTIVDTDTNGLFDIRFSTKKQDAQTDLYYYGYRYYDPKTGRWPSRDPIEERGGINLYGLVENAPIDNVDYLGNSRVQSTIPVARCASWKAWWRVKRAQRRLIGSLTEVFPLYKQNPFQHCVWNCRMSRSFGQGYAERMSWYKELLDVAMAQMRDDMIRNGCYHKLSEKTREWVQDHADSAMQPSDFKDNAAGRKCGAQVKSKKDCECCCRKYGITENTKVRWTRKSGH